MHLQNHWCKAGCWLVEFLWRQHLCAPMKNANHDDVIAPFPPYDVSIPTKPFLLQLSNGTFKIVVYVVSFWTLFNHVIKKETIINVTHPIPPNDWPLLLTHEIIMVYTLPCLTVYLFVERWLCALFVKICLFFWLNEQTETNKPPGSIQKFEEKPYFEKENHLNGIDSMEKKLKMVVIENKDSHPKKIPKIWQRQTTKFPFFSFYHWKTKRQKCS